jgi:hypothetical protein
MSNEYYVPGVTDGTTASDTNVGMPGAAPGTTVAMQGNPDPRNINQVQCTQQPAPQCGAAQVLGSGPDVASLIAQGLVPHNAQPTNVLVTPGGDSLLAQISRGQLSLNQSSYGQGGFMPANAGQSPQAPQSGSVATASIAAGAPSVPTFANPANVTGL